MEEKQYKISVGKHRADTHWRATWVVWSDLVTRLQQPIRTPETAEQYKAMSRDERARIKDVGGFVGGGLDGPHRKASTVVSRSLITLDIDYANATTADVVRSALEGTAWVLYTTHSHQPDAPRYRLIVPLTKDVGPDDYEPIARTVANLIGMDLFDDSTYQPERLMYWPSASRDGEYLCLCGEGAAIDPDDVRAGFADISNPLEWPTSSRERAITRGVRGRKQEDPCSKRGIIGAFCRCYSITEAMERWLPGVYEHYSDNRYTYTAGTSKGGALVYDDKWLYSHHGTDPCHLREVNAWDLVRIHLYGDKDYGAAPDTPVNRLKSYQAMEQLAMGDQAVQTMMARETVSGAAEDFAGITGGEDNWLDHIKVDKHGLVATHANYMQVIKRDPRIAGCVRYDEFYGCLVTVKDLPWRPHRVYAASQGGSAAIDRFDNADYAALPCWLSEAYSGSKVVKATLIDAFEAVVSQDRYHPIRDFFRGLPHWDGTPRIETLLHDYLGAEDNEVTRAMTRKQLTAAVARVMQPGCKFDYVLTLVGPEGLGKSRLLRRLGMQWFSDSFTSNDIGSKDSMEQLRGCWIIEMGELKDYNRATVESFKAFISKVADEYRPAYGRAKENYGRQCVFFASTNVDHFLKGDTGNRRFWPVQCGVTEAPLSLDDLTDDVLMQIWAEALHCYKAGEPLYLSERLEALARARQSELNESQDDAWVGVIDEALRKPIPANWYELPREYRRNYMQGKIDPRMEVEAGMMTRRKTICALEVAEEILGIYNCDRYKTRDINATLKRMGLEGPAVSRNGDKIYGLQRRWNIPDEWFD